MFEYVENIMQNWESSVLGYLPKVFLSIAIFLIFVFLARIARTASLKVYSKSIKVHYEIANIISGFIYFFFILSGVFLALKIVGLEQMLAHLLAGAGIIGIIAGFAFKDIASNIFAGLVLKIQHPFKKDDWVEIDGTYGLVQDVGWITTAICTVPGQEVFVPNQVIYNATFTNFSTFRKRRIVFEAGVSYGDDLERVKAVSLDEASKVSSIMSGEDIDFYFTDIGSSTYNFQLRFWISFQDNNDFQRAMSEIIMRIKKRFEQENISLAYQVTSLDFGVKGGVNLFDKTIKLNS